MKRTLSIEPPHDNAVAILTADIHISENTPVSRLDDYPAVQREKLQALKEWQKISNCPVLDAGDLFDHWKPSPSLLNFALENLPGKMVTIPGTHDLPEHSIQLYYKSGLSVLENVKRLNVLKSQIITIDNFQVVGIPYGGYAGPDDEQLKDLVAMLHPNYTHVLLLHELVWPGSGNPPWPGAQGYTATQILQDNTKFELIVTGHFHMAFTEVYNGRLLVNPGPMMRASIDKIKYRPRCYFYYSLHNQVTPVFYPIQSGVHDLSKRQNAAEKEERLLAYINRMNMTWDAGLSFRDNLEQFFKKNKTPKLIGDLIWRHLK